MIGLGAGRTLRWGRRTIGRYVQACTGKGNVVACRAR